VRLLNSPTGFYQDVIEMLKRAKRRILISTLYIGVEETELVSDGFLILW
jgi:CDP-diacylglycerol--glycerol-3-phosphate 3-phosphatidyltransferase